MIKSISYTSFSLVIFIFVFSGTSMAAFYSLSIDCSHPSVASRDTGNTISVDFLDVNQRLINRVSRKGIRNCNNGVTKFELTTNRVVRFVDFRTNGNDAFFIDQWFLYRNSQLIKRQGSNNAKGWCLSTDPGDTRGWRNFLVGGCRTRIRFPVPNNSTQPGNFANYRLLIDCTHPSISSRQTANRITAIFIGINGFVIRSIAKNGISNCSSGNAIFTFNTNQIVKYIELRINGNDAFFIDQWRLYRNGVVVGRAGLNNGKGWCLSTDSGDTSGWRDYLEVGCRSRIRYPISGSITPPPSDSANYRLIVDCIHPSVSSRETANRITVRFLDANRRIIRSSFKNGINNCSRENVVFSINTTRTVRYIELLTNGNDAFFIDRWSLYRNQRLIKREGVNNGKGWCLSTDSGDTSGWRNYLVSGCRSRIRFSITNISQPPSNMAVYRLIIDCNHPSVSNQETNNLITAYFLDTNRRIIRSIAKNGIRNCTSANAVFSIRTDRRVRYIELRTNGNDAFYIDQWRLTRNGNFVGGAGSNNGKGWCLSTDSGDTRGWRNYLSVGCLQRLRSNRF